MGICIDRSTKFLKDLGYNVVRLPRAGIEPLQILGVQRGEALALGTLDRVLSKATAPLPQLKRDEAVTNINGQRSSNLSASLGLNVLGAIVGAMGGNLGFKAQYKDAKTITFEYADVLGDSIVPLEVGAYLASAEVDYDNKVVEQYVLGNGRLYLITRTIKSKTFRVEAKASNGTAVTIDVPVLKDAIGGNVAVTVGGSSATAVAYEGPDPLVFGFQCFDLGIRDGNLTLVNTPAGGTAMDASEPTAARPVVIDRDGLLTLS
jgi:hypothetical protein